MAVTLTAVNCPAVQIASGLIYAADAYETPGGTATQAKNVNNGTTTSLQGILNENAQRIDLAFRHGGAGGIRCILGGLTISATGLVATVAIGQALIDGLVDVSDAITGVALTPSANNYLWLRNGGTVTPTTTTTPPTGAGSCYLGMLTTDGIGVTVNDTSGVCYLAPGHGVYRFTADTGKPADTPPATAIFYTKTASGGTWEWFGPASTYFGQSPILAPAGGGAIASSAQLVKGDDPRLMGRSQSKATNYTALITDSAVFATPSSGLPNQTITLYAANVRSPYPGRLFVFNNAADMSGYTVTITAAGSDTIRTIAGSGSTLVLDPGDSIELISDGISMWGG